jgi:membrane protein required for colicin V production
VNVFDLALLLVLALFAAFGAWRGFVRELVSLLTWAAAAVAAWAFADDVAVVFKSFTNESALRQTLAFIVIFVGVFIVGMIVGLLLHRFVNRSAGLRTANRVSGAVLGAVRGIAMIVLVFLLAGLTSFPQRTDWWRDATLAPAFERAALFVAQYLPPDVARHVRYS